MAAFLIKKQVLDMPTAQSNDQKWIQWHKDLKSTFGKKTANFLFLKAWEKRGGTSSSANTNSLREYAKGQGFAIDGTLISGITDLAYDIGDNISDIFKVTKITAIVLIVIILGGLGILIFNIARKPIETIKAASAARGGA